MKNHFAIYKLGETNKCFLGMKIDQCNDGILISQKKYALKSISLVWRDLKKFLMERSKVVSTSLVVNEKLSKNDDFDKAFVSFDWSLVGRLLYLSSTRSDIMFSASLLARFMHSPSKLRLWQLRGCSSTFEVLNKLVWYIDSNFGRKCG